MRSKVVKEKTEDADYESARLALKSFKTDDGSILSCARGLSHGLGELIDGFQKMMSHAAEFVQGGDESLVQHVAGGLEQLATRVGAVRNALDQDLPSGLQAYGVSMGEVHRLKEARWADVKAYDEAREFLRLTESSKRASATDLEAARTKAAETKERYEAANSALLAGVTAFEQERRGILGRVFVGVVAVGAQLGESLRDGPTSVGYAAPRYEPQPVFSSPPPPVASTGYAADPIVHPCDDNPFAFPSDGVSGYSPAPRPSQPPPAAANPWEASDFSNPFG